MRCLAGNRLITLIFFFEIFLIINTYLFAQTFSETPAAQKEADTLYQNALKQIEINTVNSRIKARELLRSAITKQPGNIEYRLKLCKLLESFARVTAYAEYKKITEIDSTSVEGWLNLGRMKQEDFFEWNKSYNKIDNEILINFEDESSKDFEESENYYKQVLKIDSLNKNAVLGLCFLYEESGMPERGIPLLNELSANKKDDPDLYLSLGLLYYKSGSNRFAYNAYKTAIELMSENEREDYTYNSVVKLLETHLGDRKETLSQSEMKNTINAYWKVKDPLLLTDFNERLLEHYSRIAYANLRYGVPSKNKPGWRTDRGQFLLRYGEPMERVRYRPRLDGENNLSAKTDVWYYGDMTIAFSDNFMSGDFAYSTPSMLGGTVKSQYGGNMDLFIDGLINRQPERYNPKFDGPVFDTPIFVTAFKNRSPSFNNYSDIYISYGIEKKENNWNSGYEIGVFFLDKFFIQKYQEKTDLKLAEHFKTISISDTLKYFVGSHLMTLKPDSGNLAFELIRNSDKGVSTNHGKFKIRKFSKTKLGISDLLLASDIDSDSSRNYPVVRNGIEIFPNPTGIFSEENSLFLYYEIYNLHLDENRLSDFEQRITLKRFENNEDGISISEIINSILDIIGIDAGGNEITSSADYKTYEPDPGIYFQLDMSNYEKGKYQLAVSIKDNLSGEEVNSTAVFNWQ